MLAAAIPATSRKIAPKPSQYAAPPASVAATTLPLWLKASLRPVRRGIAARPTRPKVRAAIAGGKIVAAAPMAACAATTTGRVGTRSSRRQLDPTTTAAIPTASRFPRILSISAPAGVWARTVPIWEAARAIPTRPGSQCWWTRKNVPQERPHAVSHVRQEEIQPVECPQARRRWLPLPGVKDVFLIVAHMRPFLR